MLPALFGLLATVTAWALFVASPDTRQRALEEVVAAASYTRNLSLWSHVPGTLLGHTWSLAVEEQFYLVWPVVLVVAVRARRPATALAAVFIVAFAALSALRVSGRAGPGTLFFGRPEALLLGAALALVRRDHPHLWAGPTAALRGRSATIVGAAGLVVIATWRGADRLSSIGFTLAAIAAALLIYGLVALDGRGPGALFAWRPAVALGVVSYGFYLWHMPVLRWVDDRLVGRPAIVRLGIALPLALLATLASYRLLELPALRLKRRLPRPSSRLSPLATTSSAPSPASS